MDRITISRKSREEKHIANVLKIKLMSKNKCRPANIALKNKDGKVVMEQQDVLDIWTEYIVQ